MASLTGAPGEETCTSCHGGGPIGGTLVISGLPANYTPNQEITVTVTLTQSNRLRYGFQLTAIDDTGKKAGDLTSTDGRTQIQQNIVGPNLRQYINHTLTGSLPSSTGVGSWSFKWKAPAASVGKVTFYAAGNAANGDNGSGGDTIYTTSASIQPAGLPNVASVSAASYALAPITSDSISAAFGVDLSTNVVTASTSPLPPILDGTEIKVKDALGAERTAGLFFVSPAQINYLVPTGTSNGTATVTVRRNGNDSSRGTVVIDTVSPGIFSANTQGTGIAAADALRVKPNGQLIYEPVRTINAQGQIEAVPIDLDPETDVMFVILYGTGFRNAVLNTVSCTIGGEAASVEFVGATPGLFGLDQANVRIPRILKGRGNVIVVFKVGTTTANNVTLNIK